MNRLIKYNIMFQNQWISIDNVLLLNDKYNIKYIKIHRISNNVSMSVTYKSFKSVLL